MKDKYDYVSGKSIDSEEEFLVNFDQDAVQGIKRCFIYCSSGKRHN